MNEQRPASPPVVPGRAVAPASVKPPMQTTTLKPPTAPVPAASSDQIGLAESPVSGATAKKITSFGQESASASGPAHKFVRVPHVTGYGACRVKSFLGKISVPGMEYMDNNINIWLDAHPDVEVKFVTTTVGPTDGKSNDTSITMNLWY